MNGSMSGSDRRRHPRVSAKKAVGVLRGVRGTLGDALDIENISMGGLFVRRDEPLPVGAPVIIELRHAALASPLKVLGVIAFARSAVEAASSGGTAGMGIRFDPLPADTTARLEMFLGTLARLARARPAEAEAEVKAHAQVDSLQSSRTAFDFGFASLEQYPEASASPGSDVPVDVDVDLCLGEPVDAPADVRPVAAPTPPALRRGGLQRPVKRPQEPAPVAPKPEPAAPTAAPTAAANASPAAAVVDERARLWVQVLGLIAELDDTRAELARRTRELESTREELARARATVEERERRRVEAAQSHPHPQPGWAAR